MTKELEALEMLIGKTGCMNDTCANLNECLKSNFCKYNTDDLPSYPMCPDYEMAKTLKNALLELKAIKEAKPSEALDKLEGLGFGLWNEDKSIVSINGHYFKDAYDTIKQALLKAQKNEKVVDELKTLVKYADANKQRIITLQVLRNVLKEVL